MKNNLRIRDHVKSWNEIRKAATAFSKRWKGARDGLPCCTGVKNRSVGDVAKGGIAHAYRQPDEFYSQRGGSFACLRALCASA
jgi:hypothetical protein